MATKQEIYEIEDYIESKLGYRKYRLAGRYGYYAIDVYKKNGGLERTYKTAITKKEALETLHDIAEGIESILYKNL